MDELVGGDVEDGVEMAGFDARDAAKVCRTVEGLVKGYRGPSWATAAIGNHRGNFAASGIGEPCRGAERTAWKLQVGETLRRFARVDRALGARRKLMLSRMCGGDCRWRVREGFR